MICHSKFTSSILSIFTILMIGCLSACSDEPEDVVDDTMEEEEIVKDITSAIVGVYQGTIVLEDPTGEQVSLNLATDITINKLTNNKVDVLIEAGYDPNFKEVLIAWEYDVTDNGNARVIDFTSTGADYLSYGSEGGGNFYTWGVNTINVYLNEEGEYSTAEIIENTNHPFTAPNNSYIKSESGFVNFQKLSETDKSLFNSWYTDVCETANLQNKLSFGESMRGTLEYIVLCDGSATGVAEFDFSANLFNLIKNGLTSTTFTINYNYTSIKINGEEQFISDPRDTQTYRFQDENTLIFISGTTSGEQVIYTR